MMFILKLYIRVMNSSLQGAWNLLKYYLFSPFLCLSLTEDEETHQYNRLHSVQHQKRVGMTKIFINWENYRRTVSESGGLPVVP